MQYVKYLHICACGSNMFVIIASFDNILYASLYEVSLSRSHIYLLTKCISCIRNCFRFSDK